jgi:hypothetical protein
VIPGMAVAQTIEGADTLPIPREPRAGISGYQVAAISLGAVAGVALANYLTGGMLTPMMTLGYAGAEGGAMMAAGGEGAGLGASAYMEAHAAPGAVMAAENMGGAAVLVADGAGWLWTTSQVGLTAVSAYVGGSVGNWLYGE